MVGILLSLISRQTFPLNCKIVSLLYVLCYKFAYTNTDIVCISKLQCLKVIRPLLKRAVLSHQSEPSMVLDMCRIGPELTNKFVLIHAKILVFYMIIGVREPRKDWIIDCREDRKSSYMCIHWCLFVCYGDCITMMSFSHLESSSGGLCLEYPFG